jgi:hypothetical protein
MLTTKRKGKKPFRDQRKSWEKLVQQANKGTKIPVGNGGHGIMVLKESILFYSKILNHEVIRFAIKVHLSGIILLLM